MRYEIYRKNPDSVVDFAALELKKYLRMMMPRCGEIKVSYNPDATDGFCVGLMQDFGIQPSVENIFLDDEIYIKTTETGGIIAGSNPRSVLIAVYRYLKQNGCIWLFPGTDGEQIPLVHGLKAVSYRKAASQRYRGQCLEGSVDQRILLNAIDFAPKIGMNTFMMQFDIPQFFYNRVFKHRHDYTLESEPDVSNETVLQWKRQCEAELARRGTLYHDMGHGWTAEPLGYDSTCAWVETPDADLGENRKYLAQINGVREFFKGIALNTNICMSNPKARDLVAKYVADYAQKQNNVDFLHVWLSDGSNNHCECEECRKKDTSDWYVMLLNDIDKYLTQKNLTTRIVFIIYVDTLWAPHEEKLINKDRFTLMIAPITRFYTETYLEDTNSFAIKPYVRNKLTQPRKICENFAYLAEWQKMWKGDCMSFDYHFWIPQYHDMGGISIAHTLYDDIQGLKKHNLSGIIQCGTQRAFFPNGFTFYLYGEALFDSSRSFDELVEEYFSAAYGKEWKLAYDYLCKISETCDFGFIKGERSLDPEKGKLYNPPLAEKFAKAPEIIKKFSQVLERNITTSNRPQFVCWDLLKWQIKMTIAVLGAVNTIESDDRNKKLDAVAHIIKEVTPLSAIRPDLFEAELSMVAMRRAFAPDAKYSEIIAI